MRNGGDDDDRSPAGSGDDEDVFIQAAALTGEMNNDANGGKYHVVDENGAIGVSEPSCARCPLVPGRDNEISMNVDALESKDGALAMGGCAALRKGAVYKHAHDEETMI